MTKSKQRTFHQSELLAWRTLIDHNITELPVDLFQILKNEAIPLHSFTTFKQASTKCRLYDKILSTDGFAVRSKGKFAIFLNPAVSSLQRQRFTIAHELGHILLGHLSNKTCTQDIIGEKEWQANVFASRLLAPNYILKKMEITNPKSIAEICDISLLAATQKTQQLYTEHLRNPKGLEHLLLDQFHDFIKTTKKNFL